MQKKHSDLMEKSPSKEYVKGFNHGYSLYRYESELLNQLTQGIRDKNSDYIVGINHGKAEMILEMEREKYPNKKTIPEKKHGQDMDRGR